MRQSQLLVCGGREFVDGVEGTLCIRLRLLAFYSIPFRISHFHLVVHAHPHHWNRPMSCERWVCKTFPYEISVLNFS